MKGEPQNILGSVWINPEIFCCVSEVHPICEDAELTWRTGSAMTFSTLLASSWAGGAMRTAFLETESQIAMKHGGVCGKSLNYTSL